MYKWLFFFADYKIRRIENHKAHTEVNTEHSIISNSVNIQHNQRHHAQHKVTPSHNNTPTKINRQQPTPVQQLHANADTTNNIATPSSTSTFKNTQ